MEDYRDKLGNTKGDSGTGLMLLNIDSYFPNSKKVIIHRDIKYTIDFAIKLYGKDKVNIDSLYYTKNLLDNTEGLHIEFDDIDNRLEDIWSYLTNNTPFNTERTELLKNFNIQVKDPLDIDIVAMNKLLRSI
jgi:hypothetical protein